MRSKKSIASGSRILISVAFAFGLFLIQSCETYTPSTELSIRGNKFYLNGSPTYQDLSWQGNKIEGLLFNARMVQGIFDDSNPETAGLWKYQDTGIWDPDRNTNEFIASMEDWHKSGLLAFTLNLQGGSPTGYGNKEWVNTAFNPDGSLKKRYFTRLYRVLRKSDELGMVVILGLFYFGQDEELADEDAVITAVDNSINWLHDSGFKNVIVEINNECDIEYDHDILKEDRVHELVERVKNSEREGFRYYTGTSYGGGTLPGKNVLKSADVIFLHGNGVDDPNDIREMVRKTRVLPDYNAQPIVFNEDDHFEFDQEDYNFKAAVESYASWGYFDYRKEGESFEDGYQSVPVDWSVNSERKRTFFQKLNEITGGF